MDILNRTQELNAAFSYDRRSDLRESNLNILPYRFHQTTAESEISRFQSGLNTSEFCPIADNKIIENKDFSYNIFAPSGKEKYDQAIILLHGLNERVWEKYLTWAEYLSSNTGKPVILFPIAFHMNRTPAQWLNPHNTCTWVNTRKQEIANLCNATFANVALSSRLSQNPLRFYTSGRESVFNLWQLVKEIKDGKHPLFMENTSINLFAYSIGALLSQVLLLANPDNMFSDTRLFMFCGGSIFSQMDGNARDIMDKDAFDIMRHYYRNDFLDSSTLPKTFKNDFLHKAFQAMIREEVMKDYRETFFQKAYNRIRVISLKKDIVMPTLGIKQAFGKISDKVLEELDFPFPYTHQTPFPYRAKVDSQLLDEAFQSVFSRAAAFL